MSIYRIGTVLRMTRCALGISQEELCAGICSVQTLSRMENAKVHGKRAVYAQLMEKMGRDGSRAHSKLATFDMDSLDHMAKVDTAIHKHEFARAEMHLRSIKPCLEMDANPSVKQWVGRRELLIRHHKGEISDAQLIEGLEQLLSLTVRDYKTVLRKAYPFFNEEFQLLMNIAAVHAMGNAFEQAVEINQMLLRSLETGYMGEQDTPQLKVILLGNTARYYSFLGEQARAIQMRREVMRITQGQKLTTSLINAYAGVAASMTEQIERGERDGADVETCKQCLRIAHAVASVSGDQFMKERTASHYAEIYGESIYCMNPSASDDG